MLELKKIATIYTDFPEKFGVPRQSGLASNCGRILFEPEIPAAEAIRGLEQYSYIWLLWGFDQVDNGRWSPTVRPPRLGGNKRLGVFATRSPFRPNPIALSSVRLLRIEKSEKEGVALVVEGCDMTNGTPIYDIKPYLPYVDAHIDAAGGFAEITKEYHLEVQIQEEELAKIPIEKQKALLEVLAQDPRPAYQKDANRIYGMSFAGYNIKFQVEDEKLSVIMITKC